MDCSTSFSIGIIAIVVPYAPGAVAVHFNLTIAAKLAIAYGLFLAPIGYLGYQMVADKETSIDFARKETVGLRYIAEVRSVQDAVVRGADMNRLGRAD